MVDPNTETDPTSAKRKRSPNFTDRETKVLMKFVFDHIDMVENKKTDSETWKVKNIVWNNITQNFNSVEGNIKRTADRLRQKYESIKKIVRRKAIKNKQEEKKLFPDFIDMEDYEKQLLKFLEANGSNTNGTTEYDILETSQEPLNNNIKTESSASNTQNTIEIEEFTLEDDRFVITDEDVLWDLPNDMANRPRLNLVKNQIDRLDKDEKRALAEHKYRMRNMQLKRRILINQERRAKAEHQRKMVLLELEIMLKRREAGLEDAE
ncbi:uncharacterized protein LOC115890097 [Sitophilus oryzae]|uniref:Regulatory protein zeste n=1 Tax=Sitophilus oryzae TaxID=7048 RepID=A0A6J2YPX5_SITOR|nr:uncharacterized protein LOC115890097 [Sitophilus oryzae]